MVTEGLRAWSCRSGLSDRSWEKGADCPRSEYDITIACLFESPKRRRKVSAKIKAAYKRMEDGYPFLQGHGGNENAPTTSHLDFVRASEILTDI